MGEIVKFLSIESAPKDGTMIGLWFRRQPDIVRYGRFGEPKNRPSVRAWVSPAGTVFSRIPDYWISLPDFKLNDELDGGL